MGAGRRQSVRSCRPARGRERQVHAESRHRLLAV